MHTSLAAILIAMAPAGILVGPHQPGDTIEQIVIEGVERVVSGVFGAKTSVGGVDWDRANQRLTVRDVHIANPEGFSEGDAIALKSAEVEGDLQSLLSDSPQVRVIHVTGAKINSEMSLKGSNLKRLMDNAKHAAPGGMRKQRVGPQREKRWRIDKLLVDESEANMTLLGMKAKHFALDKYETSFAGPNGEGMTSREILTQVLDSILHRVPESDASGGKAQPGQQSPLGGLLDVLTQPKTRR